jgi:hypothetical protein
MKLYHLATLGRSSANSIPSREGVNFKMFPKLQNVGAAEIDSLRVKYNSWVYIMPGSMLCSLFRRFSPIFGEKNIAVFLKKCIGPIFTPTSSNLWKMPFLLYNIGPWYLFKCPDWRAQLK